ncbi:MAG: hypothetical protein HON43_07460 [Alphaproteobacteria bacterium]|jgi:hypothetical protein|nr:hypothetical protein [Alphaproteobacteria bacterium]MBT5389546.1 hypothetical protein [Alphaproteobacteria bacterium]
MSNRIINFIVVSFFCTVAAPFLYAKEIKPTRLSNVKMNEISPDISSPEKERLLKTKTKGVMGFVDQFGRMVQAEVYVNPQKKTAQEISFLYSVEDNEGNPLIFADGKPVSDEEFKSLKAKNDLRFLSFPDEE